MKACMHAFYRSDYHKILNVFSIIKKLSQAFVSEQLAKAFKQSAKKSVETLKSSEETKSWV